MDPLVALAIGTVLLLAVLLGRMVARRPRHRRMARNGATRTRGWCSGRRHTVWTLIP
jgi:hypothetical protein